MRRVILATAFVASLATGVPVFAESASPSTSSTAAEPAKSAKADAGDPNRMVCTREHVVGSNRPQKVCMTAADRERMRDAAQRELDSSRRPTDQSAGTISSN